MAALPELQSRTVLAVQEARAAKRSSYRSIGLNPGDLGDECSRRLWYGFRWVGTPETIDGRKARLFETGDIEERRIIDDLRAADIDVLDRDEETGNQFRVRMLGGHVRGKTDGKVSNLPEAPKTDHLLECKSHNDENFKKLKKHGVQIAFPKHYVQMQAYMHDQSLTRALYYAVNKNDDEEYSERIEYDPLAALQIIARAERIITADTAPPKLHEDPAAKMAWVCGTCPAKGVCHGGDWAPRSCRTCLHSEPVMDGDATWRCVKRGEVIDLDRQRAGCPSHRYLPSLVPGEVVDSDPVAATVTYRMGGHVWVDGQQAVAA